MVSIKNYVFYSNEAGVSDEENAGEDLNETIEKIASVVQVFNTVLSCLRSKSSQRQKVGNFHNFYRLSN